MFTGFVIPDTNAAKNVAVSCGPDTLPHSCGKTAIH